MKADLQLLLTDIKAAIQIGEAESLWAALDGLLDYPEISGNPVMEEGFIKKVLLPVGEVLGSPKTNPEHLKILSEEPQAALQAIAAAAWATRLMAGEDVKDALERLATNGRQDVRAAVGLGLVQAGENNPALAFSLAEGWIKNPTPTLQETALRMFPLFAQQKEALKLLALLPPPQDPDVRAGLAEAVGETAQVGQEMQVLALLDQWTSNPESYAWVICKALGRKWASEHAKDALDILGKLIIYGSDEKQIKNTLQALERHGVGERVEKTLAEWHKAGDEKLVDFADKYKK